MHTQTIFRIPFSLAHKQKKRRTENYLSAIIAVGVQIEDRVFPPSKSNETKTRKREWNSAHKVHADNKDKTESFTKVK